MTHLEKIGEKTIKLLVVSILKKFYFNCSSSGMVFGILFEHSDRGNFGQ